jgi:hypothetical protein
MSRPEYVDSARLLEDPPRQLLTVAELARSTGLSATAVRRVCWHARVAHVRRWPGSRTQYDFEGFLAALVACSEGA